jgi:hypothetical protein
MAQMSDATEYRANAKAAAQLASQSEDDTYKVTMLKIAQTWLEMADRLTVLRATVIDCPESPDTFSASQARQDHPPPERNE